MINPLKVATSGYLKRGTKATLIIAVAGYLNFSSPVIPGGDVGGGGKQGITQTDFRKTKHERILQEDREILLMIKAIVEYELF